MFERLGLANDLDTIETLTLAFSTFVIVPIYHLLLDSIKFFANRKEWIIWLFALGELQAHSIVSRYNYDGTDSVAALLATPLLWMPSAFALETLFRMFDKLDTPIVLRRLLQAAFLGLVAYLTWTVLSEI